ncbi:helix-turn-helix transcriptional regulator [Pelagerythrobacter marensis]|uniref:Helix-turn-helix transcriptional regulator n=1 Tax=Pelagerythrobacter marensis TaxID=543877 RepID=A0ABZ2D6T6_9SPHN
MTCAAPERHEPGAALDRHRHTDGYIALVLEGGYEEAGETGRLRAAPGTVVVHHPWSAHRDRFGTRGARVLNLPLAAGLDEGPGTVADPDAIVRLAERDPVAAAEAVRADFRPRAIEAVDWPDLLARALSTDETFAIRDWAHEVGLDPASVSRGFSRVYGVSPKRFRLETRTRRALLALADWSGSLAALAAECGFADQAHLARSARTLTGTAPSFLRRSDTGDPGEA